jgi:hypothetical protein
MEREVHAHIEQGGAADNFAKILITAVSPY